VFYAALRVAQASRWRAVLAWVIASRAKSVAHSFSQTFYSGDAIANPKAFDGLNVLIPAGQTLSAGTNGGALTLDLLDELIDRVKPGRPDALCMSKRSRRKLSSLRRASGVTLETSVDQFGQHVTTYDGIPVIVDDFILDTETQGTGVNTSRVYALKMDASMGVSGLEHGGIQIESLGELETKDATRHRIKWYCGLMLRSELGTAQLRGILG